MCFAATHDIELTTILKDCYSNYHFQEEVTEDEVKFDYKLYAGPATTRNAIKLLNVIDMIRIYEQNSVQMHFLTNGSEILINVVSCDIANYCALCYNSWR